jgi:hypothetical protein
MRRRIGSESRWVVVAVVVVTFLVLGGSGRRGRWRRRARWRHGGGPGLQPPGPGGGGGGAGGRPWWRGARCWRGWTRPTWRRGSRRRAPRRRPRARCWPRWRPAPAGRTWRRVGRGCGRRPGGWRRPAGPRAGAALHEGGAISRGGAGQGGDGVRGGGVGAGAGAGAARRWSRAPAGADRGAAGVGGSGGGGGPGGRRAAGRRPSSPRPSTGVVTLRHREPGETVQPGQPVLTLMDPGDRWVQIYIPEDRIGAVSIGQRAVITSDSYPDREHPGRGDVHRRGGRVHAAQRPDEGRAGEAGVRRPGADPRRPGDGAEAGGPGRRGPGRRLTGGGIPVIRDAGSGGGRAGADGRSDEEPAVVVERLTRGSGRWWR